MAAAPCSSKPPPSRSNLHVDQTFRPPQIRAATMLATRLNQRIHCDERRERFLRLSGDDLDPRLGLTKLTFSNSTSPHWDRPHHPQAQNRCAWWLRWLPIQGRSQPQPYGAVGECSSRSGSKTCERVKVASPEQPGTRLQHTTREAGPQQNYYATTLSTTLPRHPQSMAKLMVQAITTNQRK